MAKRKVEIESEDDVATALAGPVEVVEEGFGAEDAEGVVVELAQPLNILSDEQRATLATDLKSEIETVVSERSVREDQWAEWRRMRLSQPESESKSTPWPNASNVEVPMMQSKINLVYSKFNRAFSSKEPFWTVGTDVPELKAATAALTKYLEYYSKNPFGLKLSARRREILYDCITFGTEVVRVPFLTTKRVYKAASAASVTGNPEPQVMITHDGPALIPVKIEDFFIHPYWDDVQKAPWCAIRHRLTLEELRTRESMGFFENVDGIIKQALTELPENEAEELRRRGMGADDLNAVEEFQIWDVYEVRLFYDVDGDGIPEDIIVYFEPETGVFLRSEANPLPFRDIVALRFLAIPGQFYGLGEGEILQYLQKEITSIHNRRADNQTLSMMQVWQQKRGRGSIEDGDIFPGKVLKVDEIGDVQPFAFPDLSSSAFQSESMARAYADEASGASSPLAGIADPTMKSGAGASSTMFLAQQSGDMLSSISDNLSDDFGEIGFLIIMQMIANLDEAPASPLSAEETAELNKILSIPLSELPTKLQISVQTSDISQTKDAAKQNLLTVTQIYTGYGQQAMQLAQQIDALTGQGANPAGLATPTGRMTASLLVGATDMISRVLEYFGIENVGDYVPETADLKAQMRLIDEAIKTQAASLQGGLSGQGIAGQGPGEMGTRLPAGGAPAQLGGPGAGGPGLGAGPRGPEGGMPLGM